RTRTTSGPAALASAQRVAEQAARAEGGEDGRPGVAADALFHAPFRAPDRVPRRREGTFRAPGNVRGPFLDGVRRPREVTAARIRAVPSRRFYGHLPPPDVREKGYKERLQVSRRPPLIRGCAAGASAAARKRHLGFGPSAAPLRREGARRAG